MVERQTVILGAIGVTFLAALTNGVHGVPDVLRCISIGLGAVAWLQVVKAATYRANLPENEYVRNDILVKEFILAGFIALNVGTVLQYLAAHRSLTLVAPVSIVLYLFLIYVHLRYKTKRDKIDDDDRTQVLEV